MPKMHKMAKSSISVYRGENESSLKILPCVISPTSELKRKTKPEKESGSERGERELQFLATL